MMLALFLALRLVEMAVLATTTNENELVTFVFGDSLTEVGNNNYLQYSLAKSNYPWYGIDFLGGKSTGRFTNGRTIGDIICNFSFFSSFFRYFSSYLVDLIAGFAD